MFQEWFMVILVTLNREEGLGFCVSIEWVSIAVLIKLIKENLN